MSFQVRPRDMAFVLALAFVRESYGEWLHPRSIQLEKVHPNDSTKLVRVPFDYSDGYSCARVHNLTMLGYAKNPDPAPVHDNFLEDLEARLNRQIEDRIKSLGRKGRTYHIGFPSLEGALVSISLLLFAVYLIKLVTKLIYSFNAKKGSTEYIGYLSNLRQPIVITSNRQKRSFSFDIETIKFQDLLREQQRLFS